MFITDAFVKEKKNSKKTQNHCNLSSKFFLEIRKSFENFGVWYGIVSIFMKNIYPWFRLLANSVIIIVIFKDPPSVCFDLLTLALRSTTNPTEDFVTAPGWLYLLK